jgi:hypothetical protein
MPDMALCWEDVRLEKGGFSCCCGGRASLSDTIVQDTKDEETAAIHTTLYEASNIVQFLRTHPAYERKLPR